MNEIVRCVVSMYFELSEVDTSINKGTRTHGRCSRCAIKSTYPKKLENNESSQTTTHWHVIGALLPSP